MAKIFDHENQFILRLPENLADKLTNIMNSDSKEIKSTIELQPYIDKDENGAELIKFKFTN